MNTEDKVTSILIMGTTKEKKVKLIMDFTVFKEEDIISVLNKGGINVSEIYRNLVNLSKKSNA